MATRRKPTLTIDRHHFDTLQAAKHATIAAMAEADSGEAAADESGDDLDAKLASIKNCIRASRRLRQKLGADAKLPNAECDATKAETIEQFEAVRSAMIAACKA